MKTAKQIRTRWVFARKASTIDVDGLGIVLRVHSRENRTPRPSAVIGFTYPQWEALNKRVQKLRRKPARRAIARGASSVSQ